MKTPTPDDAGHEPEPGSSTGFRDRTAVVTAVEHALDAAAGAWAWQGAPDAVTDWAAADDTKDLDVWAPSRSRATVTNEMERLGAVLVASARRTGRLQHDTWLFPLPSAGAVVDVTYGDLAVGPIVLVAERDITVDATRHALTGVSGFADLFTRPLLRGRVVAGHRLELATALYESEEVSVRQHLTSALGGRLAGRVCSFLSFPTAPEAAGLAPAARRRLARATAQPNAWASAWATRHAILPTRRPGPAGLRTRGVVVAFVGTDGSGKSTLAQLLDSDVTRLGFPVDHVYFGMARGNVAALAAVRKLVWRTLGSRVTGTADPLAVRAETLSPAAESVSRSGTEDDAPAPAVGGAATSRRGVLAVVWNLLSALAAWLYAADYAIRYATRVAPAVRAGRVVIADRYVFDLLQHPKPRSLAGRIAVAVLPKPDVTVLADADPIVMYQRKPERPLAELVATQDRYRSLLTEPSSGRARIVVDTTHAEPDLRPLVREVLRAAHRRHLPGH